MQVGFQGVHCGTLCQLVTSITYGLQPEPFMQGITDPMLPPPPLHLPLSLSQKATCLLVAPTV